MVSEVALSCEGLWTELALEGSFASVSPLVGSEVGLVAEGP